MRRRVAIWVLHQLACVGGIADGVAPGFSDLLLNRLQARGTARDQRHFVALPGESPCRRSPQACSQVSSDGVELDLMIMHMCMMPTWPYAHNDCSLC